jgi:KUP system potassium uptake protein
MSLWFLSIAVLGIYGIIQAPQVLWALRPIHAVQFLAHHGGTGIIVLGAVVLCFSGAEALFADLSHFGHLPIRVAWYVMVLPALVLNYFGQGALMLLHPSQTQTPFFTLVPHFLLWPELILATLATIIASQALISGAFSLTQQAIHMGYFPRFEIVHTSETERGQIYIGAVNWALMIACVAIVLGFRTSENLGGAYGLAVIGTMTVTSLTYFFVLRRVGKWPRPAALAIAGFFLLVDLTFLAGNVVKITSGAWVPLVLGLFVFAIFWIWTAGGAHYRRALDSWGMPLQEFLREMKGWTHRQGGTGVFFTTRPDFVPLVGQNHWLRDQVRYEQLLLLHIEEENVPYVPATHLCRLEQLGPGFWRITASFGFMQHPDVTKILQSISADKLKLDWDKLVCYLPEPSFEEKKGWWPQRLQEIYEFLRNNSLSLARYLRIPPHEIIHVGVRLKI